MAPTVAAGLGEHFVAGIAAMRDQARIAEPTPLHAQNVLLIFERPEPVGLRTCPPSPNSAAISVQPVCEKPNATGGA